MQENSNQRIEPEAFAPANTQNQALKKQSTDSREIKTSSVLTWGILAAFLILALLVLLLPLSNDDDQKQQTLVAFADNSQQLEQTIESSTPEETPWADAQLLKARREAQEILSELLGVQRRLESMRVEEWAEVEFEAIKSTAETGDSLYKERQFDQSIERYTEALDTALRLDASIPEVASVYQQEGRQLLEQNLSAEALVALEISNLLMPEVEETVALLGQANTRDSVLLLIDKSISLSKDETQLEDAKQLLSEALALDGSYTPTTELIAQIDQGIIDRDFRAQMSSGFSALGTGYYQQATAAFNRAAKLKPDNQAPLEALQQVESAKLNTQRQANLDRAIELETSEQWEAALTTYNSLLSEDGSLTAAQLGKLRSETRFKLDSDIEKILANPLSLQSESKWQAATKTLADARGIINGGPRLNTQIVTLGELILTARTPVVLKLNSDGQTNVEIYRIGKLGTFVEQAMNLNPGKYVIVGRRTGYQDVRVELSIDGSKSEVAVPVICTVTI